MSIFVPYGPDIPEQMLHLHENGRVIFFCGAGISVQAGLPLFKGLVAQLYTLLGKEPTSLEKEYIKNGQYDLAIEVLEKNYIGGRLGIRKLLQKILNPNLNTKYSLLLHDSLINLATNRKGQLRIITTNYDHLFKHALRKYNNIDKVREYSAPLLPIPKQSQLNGIVYLHGVINEEDDSYYDNLVLSSSDFGHAYLTEGWASRFVTELFKNFSICFIGYSVNDPVMRYMVDAIAADRMRGDLRINEVYAFASYGKGDFDKIKSEWENKNIIPILYDSRGKGRSPKHAKLYVTIKKWAEIYSLGISGKKNIIKTYASNPPLTAYAKDDEAVGNVLWALTDQNAAKFFSEMTPPPPLEWIKPLSTPQFTKNDLNRFGCHISFDAPNLEYQFSFLDRPAPYKLSQMSLFDKDWIKSWDNIMLSLAKWICKYLEDPRLIIWMSNNVGKINKQFKVMILDNLPHSKIGEVWSLFLANRIGVNSPEEFVDAYYVIDQIKKYGINYAIKSQLQYILTPYLLIKNNNFNIDNLSFDNFFKIVKFDIKLRGGNILDAIKTFDNSEREKWDSFQASLLDLYTYKLNEVCELRSVINDINYKNDFSYFHLPSIEPHRQNINSSQWTVLLELLREGWILLSAHDTHKAKLYTEKWWNTPYPIFKRLALFTCKFTEIIELSNTITWLSSDNAYWFWSIETQREVCRWLYNIKNKLNSTEFSNLENMIVDGPPLDIFDSNMQQDEITKASDYKKLIRLEKLKNDKFQFSKKATKIYENILSVNPKYKINNDESEEFAIWMSSGWENVEYIVLPATCDEISNYIEQCPDIDHWKTDNWEERCRDDYATIYCALKKVSKKGIWPILRWQILLSTSLQNKNLKDEEADQIFYDIYSLIIGAPSNIISELSDDLAKWMLMYAQNYIPDIKIFIELINKIISNININKEVIRYNTSRAFYSTLAKLTESLITIWIRTHDNEIIRIFTFLCQRQHKIFRNARIILCRYILTFFNLNPTWTREFLFPLLDWEKDPEEASSAWQAYLSTSYIDLKFLSEIKEKFLKLIDHFEELDQYKDQYITLITYISLHYSEYFNKKNLREIYKSFSSECLIVSLNTIFMELQNIGSKMDDYWKKILIPFFHYIWPTDISLLSSDKLVSQIARLFVYSEALFPKMVNSLLLNWLRPIKFPQFIFYSLYTKNLCNIYPKECVKFLDKLIGYNHLPNKTHINKCLDEIYNSDQNLEQKILELRLRLI